MDNIEIDKIWNIIDDNYNKYLKEFGVKLPTFKNKKGYSKNALALIRLAKNYPNNQ